jgi:hypothetical protein
MGAARVRSAGRALVCRVARGVARRSPGPENRGKVAVFHALSERTFVWSDRQKARGGAIVSITHDGKLGVMRGLIRPEDMKAQNPADEDSPPDDTGQPPARVSHPPWRTTSPRTAPPRCA